MPPGSRGVDIRHRQSDTATVTNNVRSGNPTPPSKGVNFMITRIRRGGLAAVLVLMMTSIGLGVAPQPASADVIIPITWNVNASTHLKSLNMDVVVPQGTFTGTINLTTGALEGNLALPPATQEIKFLGLKLASATFAMSPAGPITGHVDLATMQ